MQAVLTVIGKDKTGIISEVSSFLASKNVNISDISQTVLEDYFAMIMLVDITAATVEIAALSEECAELGHRIGVSIHVQHEDIFKAMHSI